jgi:REP element-mobilizing transposase RayT
VRNFYRRCLPHWQPDNADIFLTFRLYGTLPRCRLSAGHGPAPQTPVQQFVAMDRELDQARPGPTWLANPAVADAVAKTLLLGHAAWHLYELHAWVIMPNHVHMLCLPHKPLSGITNAIKSASAREANAILGRRGQPFWQPESYDHWIRTELEFGNIANYIEDNPVRGGLAPSPQDYRWSSAFHGPAPQ